MHSFDTDRAWLRGIYGLDFPDALFQLHALMQSVKAERAEKDDPFSAIAWSPTGPLALLAKRASYKKPTLDMLLHWRFFGDPPEFFSCVHGDCDGEHWGMLLDDPARGFRGVGAYFNNDGDEIRVYGGLFDALLQRIEHAIDGAVENAEGDPDSAADYLATIASAEWLRERTIRFMTEREVARDEQRGTGIASVTGLDLIVPQASFAAMSTSDDDVVELLDDPARLTALVDEAHALARQGKPAGALQLARALHWMGSAAVTPLALRLHVAAYTALDRMPLARIAETHCAHRDLRSVELL